VKSRKQIPESKTLPPTLFLGSSDPVRKSQLTDERSWRKLESRSLVIEGLVSRRPPGIPHEEAIFVIRSNLSDIHGPSSLWNVAMSLFRP
jgi:hypothetical protein